jgi:PatG Domain
MTADPSADPVGSESDAAIPAPPPTRRPPPGVTCPTCGSAQQNVPFPTAAPGRTYIYAIGRIEPRFPSISVEKEFAQALGRVGAKGKTDREAFHSVLSDPDNLYIARQLCWVMRISDVDTYIVGPKAPGDVGPLIDTLRPAGNGDARDAVIGMKGPMAPPELCNGTSLPIVLFDHLYSFDRGSLLKSIPAPTNAGPEFAATTAEVWDRIVEATDNAGATDGHRALNYLALRDPGIYARTAECYGRDLSLTAIETRLWQLSGARRVMEVIFVFTQRRNEFVEKYRARVDVADLFPFLVSRLSPYYEH